MRLTASLAVSTLGLSAPNLTLTASEFTFAFTGPTVLEGPAGSTVKAAYFCTLAHTGSASNAQGWTIHVLSDLRLAGVSLDGTDALHDFRDGTKAAEVDRQFDRSATSRVRLAADGRWHRTIIAPLKSSRTGWPSSPTCATSRCSSSIPLARRSQ